MYWSLCSLVSLKIAPKRYLGASLTTNLKENHRSCPSAAAAEWGSCSILTYLSTQVSNVFPTWMVWIAKIFARPFGKMRGREALDQHFLPKSGMVARHRSVQRSSEVDAYQETGYAAMHISGERSFSSI